MWLTMWLPGNVYKVALNMLIQSLRPSSVSPRHHQVWVFLLFLEFKFTSTQHLPFLGGCGVFKIHSSQISFEKQTCFSLKIPSMFSSHPCSELWFANRTLIRLTFWRFVSKLPNFVGEYNNLLQVVYCELYCFIQRHQKQLFRSHPRWHY